MRVEKFYLLSTMSYFVSSKLQEEKEKWAEEQSQKLTMQEVSLFIKNFNEYQNGKK